MERKTKILLLDDEEDITCFLKSRFEESGFECVTVLDVEQAKAALRSFIPDLFIIDLKLGNDEEAGLDFIKTLRGQAIYQHIPIAIFSAKYQTWQVQKGLEAGADKYLRKPLTFNQILEEARELL